jgi:chlorite dismutase
MSTGQDSPEVDVRERGNDASGQPITLDRRLFMQLLGFVCRPEHDPASVVRTLGEGLRRAGIAAVVYEDVNHPRGLALLSFTETPEDFVTKLRPLLAEMTGDRLELRPELTMIGRTYSTGFEQDLEYWLLRRPRETLMNEAWSWAIWYPLRRKGGFERLEPREKGGIMREHGMIGRSYAAADLAHDVRLACHGLDQNDNDFVIGLIGKALFPLSHVVQSMRATRQTAEYMQEMGPFFVGRAVYRSPGSGA